MPRRRALVVSTSFMLRASYASALELDGWLALEACSTDEVLWCLVAARVGEAGPIELVVADVETPGVQVLLREVHDSPRPPVLVFVGRGRTPALPRPTASSGSATDVAATTCATPSTALSPRRR